MATIKKAPLPDSKKSEKISETAPMNKTHNKTASKSFFSKIFGFFTGFFGSANSNKDMIALANPLLYDNQINNYEAFIWNANEYNLLKSEYSSSIAKHNQIVSVSDGKITPKKYIIELKQASKYYLTEKNVKKIFHKVNLEIEYGKFVIILGPSGSGKTTLLNIMSGIDQADSGDVFIHKQNLSLLNDGDLTSFRRNHVGLIFQQYNLLKHLSAVENVQIGANLASDKKQKINISQILNLLEIEHLADSYSYQLSGGEQQRFSIARALVKNPDILFCDEPTGALDQKMSNKVLEMLQKINKDLKTTIVLITHNPNFASVGDMVINFSDGKIISLVHNKKQTPASKL